MIISFSWTTPALLAGAKDVTRRSWPAHYAAQFPEGMLVDAFDRLPRVGGGKIAIVRLTRAPWQQRTSLMTSEAVPPARSDFEREGIRYMLEHGHRPSKPFHDEGWWAWWRAWQDADELAWVIEFNVVELTMLGKKLRASEAGAIRP